MYRFLPSLDRWDAWFAILIFYPMLLLIKIFIAWQEWPWTWACRNPSSCHTPHHLESSGRTRGWNGLQKTQSCLCSRDDALGGGGSILGCRICCHSANPQKAFPHPPPTSTRTAPENRDWQWLLSLWYLIATCKISVAYPHDHELCWCADLCSQGERLPLPNPAIGPTLLADKTGNSGFIMPLNRQAHRGGNSTTWSILVIRLLGFLQWKDGLCLKPSGLCGDIS